ncbi:MAG: glycosyltransferase family 39 protein [Solirubrobacteraceae bacterium]
MLIQARTGASDRARAGRWLRFTPEARIVVALTIVAAVLRFATIAHQSYWVDESQAAHELGLSFGSMLSAWNRAEWNPPLYLLVAWPWARVFGTGEAGLRSLSALLGTGLVPLLYLCGRELVSRRAGVVAAALATVSPFMIWYSQEAREYMLLVALCAGSLLFFARAWRSGARGAPAPRRALVWWAVLSALALATQYFAGFLIAAEGALLLWRLRDRAVACACALQFVVLAPLIPHVLPRLSQPSTFITAIPLVRRVQQVPVTFALGLNGLESSTGAAYGLLGAAALVAAVIALLVGGTSARALRGAGLVAGLAAFVLLVPLLLALLGHDDYIARGLMPAWPPLAVVIGAACAARGARRAGAALAVVLLALFIYGQAEIQSSARYQRPDWRGVAAALGPAPPGARAIAAYPGQFATGPLSVYLGGVPWSGPGESASAAGPAPRTVSELDVVGSVPQGPPALLGGIRLISGRVVDAHQVDRFALPAPRPISVAQAQQLAIALLPAGGRMPTIVFQRGSA